MKTTIEGAPSFAYLHVDLDPGESVVAESATGSDVLGKLRMVAIVDVLNDGISAVYTYYDPEARGSLGTYGILWQIEQTKQLKLPHLYLGYWISGSPKMAYKATFGPHQVLIDGGWRWPDAASSSLPTDRG